MNIFRITAFAICFLLFGSFTEILTGKVVRVSDGDTVVILTESNTQVKIRLEGIDCPELDQDYGQRAKQATSQMCAGKEVKVIKSGEDRYGRTLGNVYVGEVCVNKELLKMGLAWHYKKYNQDAELAKLEREAKASKVGLWSMANPVAPWDYRAIHRNN